jgi:hypothetical protein
MKVYMKRNLAGYTGTVDQAIYYYNPKLGVTLMRPYVYPKLNQNNERIVSIMANLKLINPSEGYRNNLRDYVMYYNDSKDYGHRPLSSWNNVWLKIMYAMQKANPETVNLRTITREQIYEQNLPCKTLKDAIDAGLVPAVTDYKHFNKPI